MVRYILHFIKYNQHTRVNQAVLYNLILIGITYILSMKKI